MNSQELRRDIPPDTINKRMLSPQENLELVHNISSETERALAGRTSTVATQIESSRLSHEKKASYTEMASQLFVKYGEKARNLRDIALVALVVSTASPSFAQEKDTEKLEPVTAATLTVEQDGNILDQINNNEVAPQEDSTGVIPTLDPEGAAPAASAAQPEELNQEGSELKPSDLPDPDATNSIILNALEVALKNEVEHAKENPVETGAKFASKFLKGPLKYLGDAIEVGKGIQEGKYKNDTPAETALKVGKFLLDIKTFGLGGLVIDYLKAQKAQGE